MLMSTLANVARCARTVCGRTAATSTLPLRRGYNIGTRIVDEFFAKSGVDKCRSFKDTADNIAGVAFSMFLGVTGDVSGWNADYTCCNITLRHNPLTEFVELPGHCAELHYSNLICGAVRGALEMVQMRVECSFTKDTLHGDSTNVIRLELKELVEDEAGDDYKDD